MKNLKNLAIVALAVILVTGCGCGNLFGGKLTNWKAQNALNKFARKARGGSIQVKGIQEFPQENAARADLAFTNFQFKATDSGQTQPRNYTGPGVAFFKNYNDGRWVLIKVSIPIDGFDNIVFDNQNIDAGIF
jgi:hypothetical protein